MAILLCVGMAWAEGGENDECSGGAPRTPSEEGQDVRGGGESGDNGESDESGEDGDNDGGEF